MARKINSSKMKDRWWDIALTDLQQLNVVNAVEDYIEDNGLKDDLPPATLDTARRVVPYFAEYEPKWKTVKPHKLDKYQKKAHAQYVKVVIRLIREKRAMTPLPTEEPSIADVGEAEVTGHDDFVAVDDNDDVDDHNDSDNIGEAIPLHP